jgi:hypothetical protein
LILAILIIIGVAAFFVGNYVKTANAIKEQEKQKTLESWLPDNCKCLERNRIGCQDGFVLNKSICVDNARGVFTNVLKECSKYQCTDGNYTFDIKTQMWSKQ